MVDELVEVNVCRTLVFIELNYSGVQQVYIVKTLYAGFCVIIEIRYIAGFMMMESIQCIQKNDWLTNYISK